MSNVMVRVDEALAGSPDQDHFVKEDVFYKPLSPFFNSSPPRTIGNSIYWIRQVFSDNVTSSATAVSENNVSFMASTYMAQQTSYTAIFDNYYLAEVMVTVTCTSVGSVEPIVYTAIDYDSVGNIGLTGIVGWSTVNCAVLAPGQSVTRYIKPCNASALSGTGGANAGVNRTWVDTANPGVAFYGFRMVLPITTGVSTYSRTYTFIWAFRNNV